MNIEICNFNGFFYFYFKILVVMFTYILAKTEFIV